MAIAEGNKTINATGQAKKFGKSRTAGSGPVGRPHVDAEKSDYVTAKKALLETKLNDGRDITSISIYILPRQGRGHVDDRGNICTPHSGGSVDNSVLSGTVPVYT